MIKLGLAMVGIILLTPFLTHGQLPASETSLQSHIVWSIAHEGCSAFSGNISKSAEAMRPCFLAKEAHNPEAFNLLKSAPTDDLALAIKRSLPIAYKQYEIPANFEWVLTHEHQLELFRDLERSANYGRIRSIYFQLQEHNPNAKNVLSAVSDNQINILIDRARVAVEINSDTSYEALKTIDSFTEPTATTTQAPTTVGKLVSDVYGAANANIAKLVAEKNSHTLIVTATANPNDITIPAETKIILPALPTIGTVGSVPLQPLTGGACVACLVTDPRLMTFVELRAQGTSIETEIFGHVEIPASRLQSVSQPTAADFGWYLPFLGLSSVDSADFTLVSPVPVAIIDSGADITHADLISSFWKTPPAVADARWTAGASGYDFIKRKPDPSDENGESHGTHVSGLVAGEQIGKWEPDFSKLVLSKIKLVELKVVGVNNVLDSATVQNAILAGVGKGVRIFNCSFELVYESEMLKAYLKSSDRSASTLFVVAAGNNGDGNKGVNLDNSSFKQDTFKDGSVTLSDVIMVAALGRDGKIAPFSNYGPQTVSIAAPGTDISSTIRNSKYGLLSGTSQAAPFVTLTAAMLLSELPSMSLPEIHQRILDTCDWVPELTVYVHDGCRLNIQKATVVNTDLIELRTGVILKGTVSQEGISVPGASGSGHKLERIWFTDADHMTIVATDGRYPTAASAVTIKLANPSLCVGKTTAGSCVVPSSAIKDVIFRASSA